MSLLSRKLIAESIRGIMIIDTFYGAPLPGVLCLKGCGGKRVLESPIKRSFCGTRKECYNKKPI